MILLIGINTDRVIRKLAHALVAAKKEFVYLNLKKINKSVHFDNNELFIGSNKYLITQFTSVFNRLTDLHPDAQGLSKYKSSVEYLYFLLNYKFTKVINRPLDCIDNNSKIHQITKLNKNLIKIPETMILAKKNILSSVHKDKRLIFKSLSAIRSIVKEWNMDCIENINASYFEPIQFQELLAGNNIRVHVINDKSIAIQIESNEIDYRYDDQRNFSVCELPKRINDECIELARQSGLIFCGIDLICVDNRYYLLEINPSPGYTFFEQRITSDLITDALLKELA